MGYLTQELANRAEALREQEKARGAAVTGDGWTDKLRELEADAKAKQFGWFEKHWAGRQREQSGDPAVRTADEAAANARKFAHGQRSPDPVNSPSHYVTGGIECFDAMKAMLTTEEMIGYLRGNSFKYRWRFRHKGGAEDLKKAEWYEKKLLELVNVKPIAHHPV